MSESIWRTRCEGTAVAAWRVAEGYRFREPAVTTELEVTPGGVGCWKLPLLGHVSFVPTLVAGFTVPTQNGAEPGFRGGVGLGMVSTSKSLAFLGIPKLEMTRAVLMTPEGIRLSNTVGVPIGDGMSLHGGGGSDFRFLTGESNDFSLSLGLRGRF